MEQPYAHFNPSLIRRSTTDLGFSVLAVAIEPVLWAPSSVVRAPIPKTPVEAIVILYT
ncbi:MAG TPA: hypothetical protein PK777_07775 [Thermoguttaceae bacterium]|nr:hypothetical protein [Thermoguttaceae bacterium]